MTEVRLGDKRIPFIYQGNELIHPNPVKDGLILWYDFSAMSNSDASKGIAQDLSGNGHDGTLQNFNYTDESGYTGEGLKFDGVDDVLSAKSSPTLEITSNLTIESTFLVTNSDTLRVGGLLTKGNSGRWSDNAYGIRSILGDATVSSYYFFLYDDPDDHNNRVKIDFEVGKKIHLTCSADFGAGIMRVYMDGELYHEKAMTINKLRSNNSDLYLGQHYGNTRILDGAILSSRLYNKSLTAEEIQHNYQLERERFL